MLTIEFLILSISCIELISILFNLFLITSFTVSKLYDELSSFLYKNPLANITGSVNLPSSFCAKDTVRTPLSAKVCLSLSICSLTLPALQVPYVFLTLHIPRELA